MTTLQTILAIAGTLIVAGGLLLGIYKVSQWLPQRNANRIEHIKDQTNGKIDCIEKDVGDIRVDIAEVRTEQTALGRAFVVSEGNIIKAIRELKNGG